MFDSEYETILDTAAPKIVTSWIQVIPAETGLRFIGVTKDTHEGPYYTRAEVLQWLASYDDADDMQVAGEDPASHGAITELAIHRAGYRIARDTRRAKGNRIVQTPTGWMVFYARSPYPFHTIGENEAIQWFVDNPAKLVGDGPIQWVGEDQYVLVPGLKSPADYFCHIKDPDEIIAPVIGRIMQNSAGWSWGPLEGYSYA